MDIRPVSDDVSGVYGFYAGAVQRGLCVGFVEHVSDLCGGCARSILGLQRL